MLLLSVTFLYTGLQLSFWSAVYPTAVGFTNTFGVNRSVKIFIICLPSNILRDGLTNITIYS